MTSLVIQQFRQPSGWLGRIAGTIMAARPSNRERNRWTIALLDLSPTDQVFEFGCGPGFALSCAAAKTPQGFITGVDHSPVMASMARRRLARPLREGRANILVGDHHQLRAFDGSLDAVYSANVIQFIDDPSSYFNFVFCALSNGGRVATTYQPRGKNPSKEKAESMANIIAQAMTASGFAGVKIEWLSLKTIPAVCVIGIKKHT